MKNVIATIIFLLIGTSIALPCSCNDISVKKALKKSEYAFIGKVNSITKRDIIDSTTTYKGKTNYFDYSLYDFEFEIIEIYKGENKTKLITLTTTGTEDDCGGYYKENETYLIYAYTTNANLYFDERTKVTPYLTTDICTGSKVLSKVNSKQLRKLLRFSKRNK